MKFSDLPKNYPIFQSKRGVCGIKSLRRKLTSLKLKSPLSDLLQDSEEVVETEYSISVHLKKKI